jgi:hypothetical protein
MDNLVLAEAKLTVALEAIQHLRKTASARVIVSGLELAENNVSDALVLIGNR